MIPVVDVGKNIISSSSVNLNLNNLEFLLKFLLSIAAKDWKQNKIKEIHLCKFAHK